MQTSQIILPKTLICTAITIPMDTELCEYLNKDIVGMLKLFKEDNKILKDYKVVGNNFGTTLVIRFCQPCSDMHDSTALPTYSYHKSPASIRRDMTRLHARDNNSSNHMSMPLTNTVCRPTPSMECKQTMTEDIVLDSTSDHNSVFLDTDQTLANVHMESISCEDLNKHKKKEHKSIQVKWNKRREKGTDCDIYKRNISDKARNQAYIKCVHDPRDDSQHIWGITDDLIIDLNYSTLEMVVVNPMRSDYQNFLEKSQHMEEIDKSTFSRAIHLSENSLQNIVRDQMSKCAE